MEKRRQRALEIARKRQAEINSAFEAVKAEEDLEEKKPKKRAAKPSTGLSVAPRKREKPQRPKEEFEPNYP